MSAQIKNPVTIVKQSGGGGVTKPTSWAELKTMSTADLQQAYPVGSIIDSIECKWTNTNNTTVYDFKWQIASYGTCKLENDNTDYPCVTLLAKLGLPSGMAFDAQEREICDSTTELVAEAGSYYYGTSAASGNIATNNTTVLNLSAGDTIPYGDYARVFKSSVNTTVQNIVNMFNYGYNNYKLSNIRQWLNSAANDANWFVPTHVGDMKASSYNNHRGFQSGFASDFLNVVSPTKITVLTNTVTDGGVEDVMYDKFFLPSWKEVRFGTTPDEGTQWDTIQDPADRCRSYMPQNMPNQNGADYWWLRSPNRSYSNNESYVYNNGSSNSTNSSNTYRVVPACKIILAS